MVNVNDEYGFPLLKIKVRYCLLKECLKRKFLFIIFCLIPIISSAHSITTNSTGHGTVSANYTDAEEGQMITLTVDPEQGYLLNNLIATAIVPPEPTYSSEIVPSIIEGNNYTYNQLENHYKNSWWLFFGKTVSGSDNHYYGIRRGSVLTVENGTTKEFIYNTIWECGHTGTSPDIFIPAKETQENVELICLNENTYTFMMLNGNVIIEVDFKEDLTLVRSIELSSSEIELNVGECMTITYQVKPDNALNKSVIWDSSDEAIAEVDQNGIITAKSTGSCIITATSVSNSLVKATCNVTVIQLVTGIALSENQLKMSQLGEMKQLTAYVLPEDATNKSVNWTSSNTGVCTVSSNGTVVATGYGEATVVVTTVDGGFTADCIVTVLNPKYKLTYIVDGEVYKTYEIEAGSTIIPEVEPTKDGYTFSGWSWIPTTMPNQDVTVIGTFISTLPKCATPTISIEDGQLKLSCETLGVTYVTSYTAEGVFNTKNGNEVVTSGPVVCHLSVYATKKDYQNSDIATIDIELCVGKKGDVNQDGVVTITDAVSVVNIILNEDGTISAPAMESPALEAPEVGEPE